MTTLSKTSIGLAEFTAYEPVPPEGIDRAVSIMRSGRMFRYSDARAEDSEVALLERDFARYVGARHALAVTSCTQAIELALLGCGVEPGSKVLLPGFTFSAVPSAIMMLRAIPVFVECNADLRLDLDDLERKLDGDAEVLLMSHMRGRASDMDVITELCAAHGVTLIEDAAHALGGAWDGRQFGTFGRAGCYSFQSNKIINAGEGGMLVTDDDELIVRATYLSGVYEQNYKKHFSPSPLFAELAGQLPMHNVRMTNLTAAVARCQIGLLEDKGRRYREMYAYLKRELTATGRIELPCEYPQETRIPDSIQFRVPGYDAAQMRAFIQRVRLAGLPLAGFAEEGNARAFYNWQYLGRSMPELPQTREAIRNVCDMRLASSLGEAHLAYIVSAVRTALQEVDELQSAPVL